VKLLAHHGVVVTRCEPEGGPLARRLEARGARIVRWATTKLAPPSDPKPLERALAGLAAYDWLVVTSAHGAAAVTARVETRPAKLRVAAVGPATAAELEAAGWAVDLVGPGPGAEALARALAESGVAGARVLFPAGSLARETLVESLAGLDVRLDRVEAYRTLPARLDVGACFAQLDSGAVDAITFASPSAVDGLARALGRDELPAILDRIAVASIGPTTTAALVAAGRAPDAEAAQPSLDSLVDAVGRALAPAAQPSPRSRAAHAAGERSR
jgi:uroporphyrinogen III methyltransferase/synthase